jgi:RNA polymerase sigma-70 factor (sigma-E family)
MRPELEREYVEYVQTRLPTLRRTAYRLCGDAHRGDDLVQQTITKLFVNWRRARAADSTDAYVRRILVHAFLDERRLGWSRVSLFPSAPGDADGIATAPLDSAVEDRTIVRAALDRLPRGMRAVLVLRFLCDLPVDEVADTLGCRPGTVKSQTARGLALMRRLLDECPVTKPVTEV